MSEAIEDPDEIRRLVEQGEVLFSDRICSVCFSRPRAKDSSVCCRCKDSIPGYNAHANAGRKRQYTNAAILEALAGRTLTMTQLADTMGMARTTVFDRVRRLKKEGRVVVHKVVAPRGRRRKFHYEVSPVDAS